MNAYNNALTFFNACESLEGYEGCKTYMTENATFEAQAEPVADIKSLSEYVDWMRDLGKGPLKGCSYEINASALDADNNKVLVFATINGSHNGAGGPVEPTGKSTSTDFVYVLTMNNDDKVVHLTKVWNAGWAMKDLGWA